MYQAVHLRNLNPYHYLPYAFETGYLPYAFETYLHLTDVIIETQRG